jgi:hypothetical protein
MQKQGMLDPEAEGGEGRKKVLRSGKKVLEREKGGKAEGDRGRWGEGDEEVAEDEEESDMEVMIEGRNNAGQAQEETQGVDAAAVTEGASSREERYSMEIDWEPPQAGPSSYATIDQPSSLAPSAPQLPPASAASASSHPFLPSTKSLVISFLTGRTPPPFLSLYNSYPAPAPLVLDPKGKGRAMNTAPASTATGGGEDDESVLTLLELLRGTVERGEGNSCLIQGVQGCGKTAVRGLFHLLAVPFDSFHSID